MSEYSVIVGNIGQVHIGRDLRQARAIYDDYVIMSACGVGRAANEEVHLMRKQEPMESFSPGNAAARIRNWAISNPSSSSLIVARCATALLTDGSGGALDPGESFMSGSDFIEVFVTELRNASFFESTKIDL